MLLDLLGRLGWGEPLFNMATVLLVGIVGGELFARFKLPKVTGWIATGIILRSFGLPGLGPDDMSRYAPLNHIVLGYIAFTVGATLYLSSLRNTEKRIGLLLLCELILTPTIVAVLLIFVGPYFGDINFKASLLLAAIAIAGAPGTTVLVIQEARARGILSRTLIAAVGLIDMVAVAVFIFVSTFMRNSNVADSLVNVGTLFATTFAIAAAVGGITLLLIRYVVSPAFVGPAMFAVILGSWGLAGGYKGTAGGILACTFAGIFVTNMRHDIVRATEAYLHGIGGVLFAMFYTLAGMRLNFGMVFTFLGLVVLYFFARLIGKWVSAYTAMSLAGVTAKVRNYLGIALLPHGGVAVGLLILIGDSADPAFADIKDICVNVGLAALAINQLLGPSATRFSTVQAGEFHKDRPRLLDFLEEQRISVGVTGNTREEVIKSMVAQLYATTAMDVPQEEFLKAVLDREEVETTCVGEGLMIPHAVIADGKEVKGVLGINRKGLDLDAPDEYPVHAVLLLATPEADRKRHLEVLSNFATAITRDVNYREQLYHARSPAHAYEVLHHDDAEDVNYFLEDALERAGVVEKS